MSIDYAAVLDDLHDRRDKLDVAIEAIEEIIGVLDASTDVRTASGIGPFAFVDMTVVEAAVAFLKMAGEPQATADIARALESGGFKHSSENFYNTVYGILKREHEQGTRILKAGKRWALGSGQKRFSEAVREVATTRRLSSPETTGHSQPSSQSHVDASVTTSRHEPSRP